MTHLDDTPCLEHPFLDFMQGESFVSEGEKAWFRWVKKVEKLLGHSLDGDQEKDGYSLDYAHDAFMDGLTAEQYAAECCDESEL